MTPMSESSRRVSRRVTLTLLLVSLTVCVGCSTGRDARGGHWRYDVEWIDGGARLRVVAAFDPPHSADIGLVSGAEKFVSAVELRDGDAWRPARAEGRSWRAPFADRPVIMRWEFDVEGAARFYRQVGRAASHKGAWLAPPSTWLMRPTRAPGDVSVTLGIADTSNVAFVTGLPPSGEPGIWRFAARHLGQLPFTAFGTLDAESVSIAGSRVDVAFLPGRTNVPRPQIREWVVRSTTLMAEYFGRLPGGFATIIVAPGRNGIGKAMGNGGGSVFYPMGTRFRERSMELDWVLMHELVHLGVPQVNDDHHWFEEGVATYVEPLIRVRAGIIDETQYWRELIEGLPRGLPRDGDRGLDVTHTWGRTYWGGALFCFLADLAARRATDGERSFDDAMRHIVSHGGSIASWQSMTDVMELADEGIGRPVFMPLYRKMARSPHPVDLEASWRRLGVRIVGEGVVFDDTAPESAMRRAMTRPR